ncbi:acyl carrier protein [Pseudovibrio ascidiaceicola]|uniref:acyl carrier protein n=1 Tax=Pseudovibrio ascidiaceicola TaxID=285279 RepID=UPI000D695DA4|nr:acyl carrier protein [Pseudovibrio ascidiaceicola]
MADFEKVSEIIGDVLEIDLINVSIEDSNQTLPGWDSLAAVNIATAVISEFKIEFDIDQLEKYNSVKGIMSLIKQK